MRPLTLSILLLLFHGLNTESTVHGQEEDVPDINHRQPNDRLVRPRFSSPPSWLTSSQVVPAERDRASQKLFHLKESSFQTQPDEVAMEIVVALELSTPDIEDRVKLNEKYAALLEKQIKSWRTEKIRAEIRVELVKRDARDRQRQRQLANIAQQLADLERSAETRLLREQASAALKATGYVAVNGKVMLRDEAYPPFGFVR